MKSVYSQVVALFLLVIFYPLHAAPLPLIPGVAHHPIHYKPEAPSLLPTGLTPAQVRRAYGFTSVAAQGKGQLIAIVNAYDHPNIEADLAVFNKRFSLPACTSKNGCFKKLYANGKKPRTDAGWAGEIALDVEWAHAMAPQAKILLVEAASNSLSDLFAAIQVAVRNGASVVSMSWGGSEFPQQKMLDSIFNNPRVTFVAASGDSGTGVLYPASSPYVLAVGGTSLLIDRYGNHQLETAWSGSGGGLSVVETASTPQRALPIPLANNRRGVPDVAYNADPETGFSVYTSIANESGRGWLIVGGTSAGAPQWAALVAVANSALGKRIGNTLGKLLYGAARPAKGHYHYDFNDIRYGSNGSCKYYCTARLGYDYVTGLGTPKLGYLIYDLR